MSNTTFHEGANPPVMPLVTDLMYRSLLSHSTVFLSIFYDPKRDFFQLPNQGIFTKTEIAVAFKY